MPARLCWFETARKSNTRKTVARRGDPMRCDAPALPDEMKDRCVALQVVADLYLQTGGELHDGGRHLEQRGCLLDHDGDAGDARVVLHQPLLKRRARLAVMAFELADVE